MYTRRKRSRAQAEFHGRLFTEVLVRNIYCSLQKFDLGLAIVPTKAIEKCLSLAVMTPACMEIVANIHCLPFEHLQFELQVDLKCGATEMISRSRGGAEAGKDA